MAKAKIDTSNAQESLESLKATLETLKKQMDAVRNSGGPLSKAQQQSLKNLEAESKRTKSQINSLSKAQERSKRMSDRAASAMKKDADATKKDAEEKKKLTKNTKETEGSFRKLTRSVHALLSAFGIVTGIQLFADILRNTYRLTLQFDSLRFALERVTETNWAYAQSQQFLFELNRKYGAELTVTAERWTKFRAAAIQSNMTLQDSEKIFGSVTKAAAVLGLSSDDLQSSYLALEQMLSKGKITTEELRRQLGEKIPGAMGIMAAATGVTMDELDKMMKKGEVISHEVLPDFADALEVAFGIENVEKVETLRSEIGRLSGMWQTFVANMAESEGIFMKTLKRFANGLQKIMDTVVWLNASENQKFRMDVSYMEDDHEAGLERKAIERLEELTGEHGVRERLKAQMDETMKAIGEAQKDRNAERAQELREHHNELMRQYVDYGKQVSEQERVIAAEQIREVEAKLEKEKKIYEEAKGALADAQEEDGSPVWESLSNGLKRLIMPANPSSSFENDIAERQKRLKEFVEEQREITANLQSEYNVLFKTLEMPGNAPIDPIDTEGLKKRTLDDIRDLEKEIQISIVEKRIAAVDKLLKEEEVGWERRIKLEEEQFKRKNRISELQYQIEIDKIRKKEKEKLDELNRPAKENEEPLTEDQIAKQTAAIQKKANQEIEIAENNHLKRMVELRDKYSQEIRDIETGIKEDKLADIEDEYNVQIIAAKEAYEASDRTAQDRKRLDDELKRIAIEAGNAQIDMEIKLLEAKKANRDLDEDRRAEIDRLINKLKAMREVGGPSEDTAEGWKEYFAEILGYAREYNRAMSDIVDGLYGRKIEAINAEIDAEKEKYDALMLLAKDDAKQKETLERNRDLRIKELEKKRLKEEQKQARARKAFAISEIVINTAVAVSKVLGQSGIFGIPLVPIVSALGAMQIAAVLAQPIPQYKDGGNVTKDEIAMINDGIAQEYVERDGKILTTERKNAIVALQKGDVVHKDYDALTKDSDVLRTVVTNNGGEAISEKDFNRLFTGITTSVSKGISKAKLKNQIILKQTNNDYKSKMTRW